MKAVRRSDSLEAGLFTCLGITSFRGEKRTLVEVLEECEGAGGRRVKLHLSFMSESVVDAV